MREPSDKTKLVNARREMATLRGEMYEARRAEGEFRRRATKAEQDAAEWKRRFDLLFSKLSVVSAEVDAGRIG